MANNTTGLQSNEVIEKQNYLGSIKLAMQSNTGSFKIKQSLGGERVVIMFLIINQEVPRGIVLGVFKNNNVTLQSNSIIERVTPTLNGDGSITFEVTVFENSMWSHCAILLPKEYII